MRGMDHIASSFKARGFGHPQTGRPLCFCTALSQLIGQPYSWPSAKEDHKSTCASTPCSVPRALNEKQGGQTSTHLHSLAMTCGFDVCLAGEGLFLALCKAQMCTDGKQGLKELYNSPEHTKEEDAVTITLRNKTEAASETNPFIPALPLITCKDDTDFQRDELITQLTQLHLTWPLPSVDKELTMRFLLS